MPSAREHRLPTHHMSLKRYLIIMGIGTAIAAASWVMVLLFLDPQVSGTIGIILFFTSFFMVIFGISSIVGYLVRRIFQRHEVAFKLVGISFRQAVLIATLLTGCLFLQSKGYFTWWTSLLLLVFLSLLEAFFVARASGGRHAASRGAHGA